MANNRGMVTLRLPEMSVGQIIDGLDVLIEQWRHTADYMETGAYNEEIGIVRECSGEEEAEKIASFYQDIRDEIERQIASQKRSTS